MANTVSEIDKKIAELKAQRKVVIAKAKEKAAKTQNKRWLKIGKTIEKYCDVITNFSEFENFVKTNSDKIKQTQSESAAAPEAEKKATPEVALYEIDKDIDIYSV